MATASSQKVNPTILDKFLEDLCNDPNNWTLRGVIADWAEDNGISELAQCLRWMITNKKRPYHGENNRATWFNAETISQGLGDNSSDIPAILYNALEGGKERANHKTFSPRKEAETAFYAAWKQATAEGWKP